jgi:hypothetical protein
MKEEIKREIWELKNKIEIGKPVVRQLGYEFSDETADFYTFITQSQRLKQSNGCDWFLFSSLDIEDTIKLIIKETEARIKKDIEEVSENLRRRYVEYPNLWACIELMKDEILKSLEEKQQ